MRDASACSILTLNAGSSSIRFALYENSEPSQPRWREKLEGIGSHLATLTTSDADGKSAGPKTVSAPTYPAALELTLDWLCAPERSTHIGAVIA